MLHVVAASSLLFGAGLLPLFFYKGKEHQEHPCFQFVLSFAVGVLLGDVFIHLLPEAWSSNQYSTYSLNLLVLSGVVLFFTLDRLLGDVVGYLTVFANTIDNFLHGLAIAVSFSVSNNVGWLTTAGILLHELPHEITDYAVLANSGFTKNGAMLVQLWTCSAGMFGALSGKIFPEHCCRGLVLPITSGVFLYVSMTSLIPGLLKASPKNSFLQVLVMATAIGLTYAVTLFDF